MTTVKLSKPVEHGGKIYDEFTFREAEVGDLMLADAVKGETSKVVAVLASMADVPLPAFRKVKSRDLNAIMAATKDLLGEEPPVTTGV